MQPSNSHKCEASAAGILRHTEPIACDRCGEKFRSAAERIRMDGQRCVCGWCYQNIAYPDHVFRHSDLPD